MSIYPAREWWKNDPMELIAHIYWVRDQIPPDDIRGAWDSIVASLNKKYPAPEIPELRVNDE